MRPFVFMYTTTVVRLLPFYFVVVELSWLLRHVLYVSVFVEEAVVVLFTVSHNHGLSVVEAFDSGVEEGIESRFHSEDFGFFFLFVCGACLYCYHVAFLTFEAYIIRKVLSVRRDAQNESD